MDRNHRHLMLKKVVNTQANNEATTKEQKRKVLEAYQ